MSKVRVAGVVPESSVDGPGLRYTIFFQGCGHYCEGCQNPQTWSFGGGYDLDTDQIVREVQENPLLRGVTFSGGDPVYQADQIVPLAKELKELGYHIIMYTGYRFEDIMEHHLMEYVDWVIDGPYEQDKKSLSLCFRGSSNQRVIDVQKSLQTNDIWEIQL